MGFEKLRVYQAAELLDKLVQELIASAPKGCRTRLRNLAQCVASIPHNIAEAHGNEQPGRKRNHLNIARGSADETRSELRKQARDGVFERNRIMRPSSVAITVAKMLTNWIDTIPDD